MTPLTRRRYRCGDSCGLDCIIEVNSTRMITEWECPGGRGFMYRWKEITADRAEGIDMPQECRCPAGTRSADEILAKLSRIQSLEYRPARPLTFAWGAIWALRWALGEVTADRPWIIYCECDDGDRYEDDGLGGERQ